MDRPSRRRCSRQLGSSRSVLALTCCAPGSNAEIYHLFAPGSLGIVVGVLEALAQVLTVSSLRRELDPQRMAGLAHAARDLAPALSDDLGDLASRGRLTVEALAGMRARL